MGVFDFMMSEEKKIAKHVRRLTNRDKQPEDREASAVWLAEQGSPQALIGMLSRFDVSLDQSIKDQGEKDQLFALAVRVGEPMVAPCKAWLLQCKSVARPLALLQRLLSEEAAIQAAYEVLEVEREHGNDFKPDKKKAVLIWLTDRKHAGAVEAVLPLLSDFDEGVRYAAVEVIAAQDGEHGVDGLIDLLLDPEEESNRLRARVCEVFAARSWSVEARAAELESAMPDGFAVRDGRIVA